MMTAYFDPAHQWRPLTPESAYRRIHANPNFSDHGFELYLVFAGQTERAIEVMQASTRLEPYRNATRLAVARGEHLKAMRANGLRLETPKGDTVINPVEATEIQQR